MLIFPRGAIESCSSLPWADNCSKAYGSPALSPALTNSQCIFPLVRQLLREAERPPSTPKEQLRSLCAILTDRGLLAGQMRELFSDKSNESEVTTKLGYFPVIPSAECHLQCQSAALKEFRTLWHTYFPNNSAYDSFGALLDALHEDCKRSRKTASQVLDFPNINQLNHSLARDDNVYPDEYECAYAERIRISFRDGDEQSALGYFLALIQRCGLRELPSSTLMFFLHYPLRHYYIKDRTLHSVSPGKQHIAVIAARDIPRLHEQANAYRTLFAGLSTVHALLLSKDRFPPQINIPSGCKNQLFKLLKSHNDQCHSCRTNKTAAIDIEAYIKEFAKRITDNWSRLSGNPYLIFSLWSPRSQSSFTNGRSISLFKLLSDACQPRNPIDPNVRAANQKLFSGLLKLCLPNAEDVSLRRGFLSLFDALESTADTPGLLSWARAQLEQNLADCLRFEPSCLRNYPSCIVSPAALQGWLDARPLVFGQLRGALPQMLSATEFRSLRKSFRLMFETPSPDKLNVFEITLTKALHAIAWDALAQDLPPLISYSPAALREFRQFLIAWVLLEMEITDTKRNLRQICSTLLPNLLPQ